MEEEKIPKQKPHTSFKRQLPVVKKPEGNMTTAKKNIKKIYFTGGTWQRGGNMAKGITVIWVISKNWIYYLMHHIFLESQQITELVRKYNKTWWSVKKNKID